MGYGKGSWKPPLWSGLDWRVFAVLLLILIYEVTRNAR